MEAADVALILWLTRDLVWSTFSTAEREQAAGWLRQVEVHEPHGNNWLLLKVQILEALRALGMPSVERLSAISVEPTCDYT